MKQLKFKFDLDSKAAIYVPSTVAVNNDDSEGLQEKFTREVLSLFSRWFGGATATDALGGGVSGGAELIVEKVKIVYAFCTKEAFADHLDELLEVCERIKRDMGQEAVTLEYNGQVKFV